MKTKISDMMDNIQDETVQLNPQSIVSSDKIKEITMNKLHNDANTHTMAKTDARRPRKLSKGLRSISIAAAVMCILSLSVLAVNYFTNGAIIAFFQSGAAGSSEQYNELSDIQLLTIENYTTQFNQSVEIDGTTVTLKSVTGAATSSNIICYCVFEVESPENTLQNVDNAYIAFERYNASVEGDTKQYSASKRLYVMDDEQGRENVKTIVVTYLVDALGYNENVNMTIDLQNFWIDRDSRINAEIISEGVWSFDFQLSLNAGVSIIDKDILFENGIVVLNGLELSPLGGSYITTNADDVPRIERIVMRDGSVVTADLDGAITIEDERVSWWTFTFGTPTDLTEADYVLFADGTRIDIQ